MTRENTVANVENGGSYIKPKNVDSSDNTYLGREYMARIAVRTPTALIEAFSGVLQVFQYFVYY
jgi:hypothetical protein